MPIQSNPLHGWHSPLTLMWPAMHSAHMKPVKRVPQNANGMFGVASSTIGYSAG
jgi:hypothetical protein